MGAVLSVASQVVGMMGQTQKTEADASQANYLAQVARNNQAAAQRNAALATQQGEVDAQKSQLKTAALEGSQRAALASQGGDVDSGSPLDIVGDTARAGATDAATIRSNAALKAYNYQLQANDAAGAANDDSFQAANALASLPYSQGSTLLGGASRL
jgi:multidrug efflux pump subunit AcrA (membrane-fusion protein)